LNTLDIEPFRAMGVLAEARRLESEGRSIVHLELGEPSIAMPPSVQEAVLEAMRMGRTGYTQALGLPGLKKGIAACTGYGTSLILIQSALRSPQDHRRGSFSLSKLHFSLVTGSAFPIRDIPRIATF
jgi:hypothetical protein